LRAPIKIAQIWGARVGEILFEFSRLGNVMRVTAIDADTNTEIVIAGPATAPKAMLQNTALQKLRYVLAKKKGEVP
jgi:hypothetical protein